MTEDGLIKRGKAMDGREDKRGGMKKTLLLLLGFFAIVAIGALGWIYYVKHSYSSAISALLEKRDMRFENLEVDWHGTYKIKNVKATFLQKDDVTIDEISGSAVAAENGYDVDIKNLKSSIGPMRISIPLYKMEGAQFWQGDPEAVSEKYNGYPVFFAAQFEDNVRKMTIPEIRIDQKNKNIEQSIIYKDIVYNNIEDDNVRSVTVAEVSQLTASGKASRIPELSMLVKVSSRGLKVENINLRGIPKVFPFNKPQDVAKDAPYEALYGSYGIERTTYEAGFGKGMSTKFTIGRTTMSGFSMRPLPFSVIEAGKLMQQILQQPDKVDAKAMAELADIYLTVLEAIGPTEVVSKDINISMPLGTMLKVDEISFGYDSNKMNIGIGSVKFTSIIGLLSFDNIKISGLRFPNFISTMKAFVSTMANNVENTPTSDALENRRIEAMIPRFDHAVLENYDMNFVFDGPFGPRNKQHINKLEIAPQYAEGPVPTALKVDLQGYVFPAAGLKNKFSYKDGDDYPLKEFGYDPYLNLDFSLDSVWNQNNQTIAVKNLDLTIKDMFAVDIKAQSAPVDAKLFSADLDAVAAAADEIAIKNVQIGLKLEELLKRISTRAALGQDKTAEDVLQEWAELTVAMITEIGEDDPTIKNISQKIRDFILHGGRLVLSAEARNEKGFSLSSFDSSPFALKTGLKAFDMQATYEGKANP